MGGSGIVPRPVLRTLRPNKIRLRIVVGDSKRKTPQRTLFGQRRRDAVGEFYVYDLLSDDREEKSTNLLGASDEGKETENL